MNNIKQSTFNFCYRKVKDKIIYFEREYDDVTDKVKQIAKNIRYFDIDRQKYRKELEETKEPEVIELLGRYNKLKDNIRKMKSLLSNIKEQQGNNEERYRGYEHRFQYGVTKTGKANSVGFQLYSLEPELVFELAEIVSPIFLYSYQIRGTTLECLIVDDEEDRRIIKDNPKVEEVLFLGDRAYIKRIENLYLVRNELTGVLEWSEQKFNINTANDYKFIHDTSTYDGLQCIFRVVPFLKEEWLGKTIRESNDINDNTPWDEFYKMVNTTGYIRII